MPSVEAPNPFDKREAPELYRRWEEGFRAYETGKTVPDEHLQSSSRESNAWLNGYTAARLSS